MIFYCFLFFIFFFTSICHIFVHFDFPLGVYFSQWRTDPPGPLRNNLILSTKSLAVSSSSATQTIAYESRLKVLQ